MALLQLAGNGQTRTLRRAIRALEAASNVYREDREPVLCAAVRSNLGFALAKDGIARRDVRVALKGLELALNAWSILAREMPVPARASAEQIVLILGRLWTTKSLRETPEFVGFIQENGIRLMEVEVPQSMYPTAGTFSGSPSQLGALFILSPPASHGTEDMDEFALAAGYGTIGTILASAGRVEDAIAWLRRTVELRPDDQEGVYNLGLAYHLQGKLDAACLLLRKARALAPRDTATLNTLGLCLMDSGNRDEAKEVFVSLVEADPSFVKGWNNLALLLIQLNDHKGAANCFRRVVALSPRPDESAFLDQAY